MYFKRIEMQGFKSFADPVNIEFNEGVTCIIGPNGSGKSNISDALRWVLGEQSSKQLRGSKMQDVIFAGTATRKPKGMAEVTLVIDNSNGILPLEYNEVAVTRRMFRSGESEYLINGNQCRLRDIRELFMDTGIGVEGYSIIGQGKIADIVSTRPENRRQIFEEAAGVVLYKSRKSEAENKLRAATVDLDRVRDIIAEIEGRIGGLKEDSEKATEYIGLRDRYKTLGINIILHNLGNLEVSVREGKEELEALQAKLDLTSARIADAEEELEVLRDSESDLNEEFGGTNARLLEAIDELADITSGGKLNKERLANIEKELARLEEELSSANERLGTEKAELERLEEGEKAMNRDMDKLRKELEDAVIKFNEDNRKSSSIAIQTEEIKNRLIDINHRNVTRNAEIKTLSNYKTTLEERRETLREEFETRDRTDTENRENLKLIQQKIEENEAALTEKKKELDSVNDNIITVATEIEKNIKEIDEISVRCNQAIARRSTIEEMEANYEGYNNAVRSVMNAQRKGIIGTVSDIIDVPGGFETAVETALGNALQNIVCEDDASATDTIDWLKQTGLGRCTFLPVKSVRADRLRVNSSVSSAAGYIGIASEMVGCDERFREIVDYLLCRVIIADDMEKAIRISKMDIGGFRIVTRDGEVINAYGAITGGRYRNRTANLLDRKKEISTLKARIAGYNDKTAELNSAREKLDEKRSALRAERDSLRAEITEFDIAANVLRADKEHAESLVREDEGAAERFRSSMETLASDIERADAMISGHKKGIEEAEQEYSEAEAKADDLMKEAEALKPVIEHDNEAIVALKVKIGESESRMLADNEMIERVRDDVTELEAAVEDNLALQKELSEDRDRLTTSGEESGDRERALSLEKAELEEKIADITARLEDGRGRSDALMASQKKDREELESVRDERYRLEVRTARNETLLDTQKDKLWDEFEVSYAEALDMRDENFAITAGNRESREIRLRLAELGDVNVGAIEEYKAVSKRYEFMTAQEADLTKAMNELNEIISNMDKTIRTKFKENFDRVVVNFEESFKELFGGGYAELRLEDETKPLESGIEITAQPPGKKLKNINLLSGGEKTLTAIALMFAVLKAKPTPFVILDEVEAALDEVNIERFSDYLRNFENIQFALITHQKATMEHADVLYGVTMPEQGISRMLSLKLGDEFDPEGLE